MVASLELKIWATEGWEKVTIAFSSAFVYQEITESVAGCLEGRSHKGKRLQNVALWEGTFDLIKEQASHGCEVQFWLNSRVQAVYPLAATRMAAESEGMPMHYQSLCDMEVTSTVPKAKSTRWDENKWLRKEEKKAAKSEGKQAAKRASLSG